MPAVIEALQPAGLVVSLPSAVLAVAAAAPMAAFAVGRGRVSLSTELNTCPRIEFPSWELYS